MFQFMSSRRGLFRFIGGAVAGIFASRATAQPSAVSGGEGSVSPSKVPLFKYDAISSPYSREPTIVTFTYDSSRPITMGNVTTFTYEYGH